MDPVLETAFPTTIVEHEKAGLDATKAAAAKVIAENAKSFLINNLHFESLR